MSIEHLKNMRPRRTKTIHKVYCLTTNEDTHEGLENLLDEGWDIVNTTSVNPVSHVELGNIDPRVLAVYTLRLTYYI